MGKKSGAAISSSPRVANKRAKKTPIKGDEKSENMPTHSHFITGPSRDMGYNNGGQSIHSLSSSQMENLQNLTSRLRFDRSEQTIEWLLRLANNELFLDVSCFGFQYNGAETINWLLQQAQPAISNIFLRQDTQAYNRPLASPANVTGYPGTYSSTVAPPFLVSQFSQNPQPVTRIGTGFTPTGGLGGGTCPTYSPTPTPRPQSGLELGNATLDPSNPYSPTPVRSNRGPPTARRTPLPIPNPYFNEFSGGQSQMMEQDQLQWVGMSSNSMHNWAPTNMQEFPHPQSQNFTWQGESQQPPQNFECHNMMGSGPQQGQAENHKFANTGNIGGGAGASMPMNPAQHRGTWNAQNHLPAIQQPFQISGIPLNHSNHMSSSIPVQGIMNQVEAPAQIWTQNAINAHDPNQQYQNAINGHDPNQLYQNDFNRGQSQTMQIPIDFPYTQSSSGYQTVGESSAELQNNSQSIFNNGQPLADFNNAHPYQEGHVHPAQQTGQPIISEIEGDEDEQAAEEHTDNQNGD